MPRVPSTHAPQPRVPSCLGPMDRVPSCCSTVPRLPSCHGQTRPAPSGHGLVPKGGFLHEALPTRPVHHCSPDMQPEAPQPTTMRRAAAMPFRPLRRFLRDERGTVSIEFALIAPLLMALLFGIVTLGYYMGVSHSVRQLASGAARASVPGLDQTERLALAQAYLAQAGAHYPLLTTASVAPQVVFETGPSAVTVQVAYAVDGSLLAVANNLLKLNLSSIDASAYLAY